MAFYGGSSQSIMQTCIKTADQVINNSNTLTDDTELQFEVKAGETYWLESQLYITTDSTPDFKYNFDCPAGSAGWFAHRWPTGYKKSEAFGTPVVVLSTELSSAYWHRWDGFIKAGADGKVKLQWAQDTADASDTKLLAGSFIIVTKVG